MAARSTTSKPEDPDSSLDIEKGTKKKKKEAKPMQKQKGNFVPIII